MFEKSLHEIAFHLRQVLQYGVPDGFRAIEVYFDPNKKPVMIVNATHLLEYMGSEKKGLVLKYVADPRNVHDREIFHLLDQSPVFEGFEQKPSGYEGKSFHCHFGNNQEKIMETMKKIFTIVQPVTASEKITVHFRGSYGPEEKGFLVVD